VVSYSCLFNNIKLRNLHKCSIIPTYCFESRKLIANYLIDPASLVSTKTIDTTIFDMTIWVADVDEVGLWLYYISIEPVSEQRECKPLRS
jgi:hypothetical protein